VGAVFVEDSDLAYLRSGVIDPFEVPRVAGTILECFELGLAEGVVRQPPAIHNPVEIRYREILTDRARGPRRSSSSVINRMPPEQGWQPGDMLEHRGRSERAVVMFASSEAKVLCQIPPSGKAEMTRDYARACRSPEGCPDRAASRRTNSLVSGFWRECVLPLRGSGSA